MSTSLLLAILVIALAATPSAGSPLPAADDSAAETGSGVEELVLANGMRVLILERPGLPLVAAGWATHSGSAVETPGKTGVAHLIEHLLFGGTEVIGTTDYRRERELIDRREELEDARRSASPPADVERQIERVEERLRELRRKGEYALLYTEAGALGINGVTNQDLSYYTVSIPPARLELWFWLESDRLLRPVFREIYDELPVVEEERGQRILSVPGGPARTRFDARFWGEENVYSWPAIGRPEDLQSLRRADVESFFRRHYRADRLTAVLIGDFDAEQVREWVQLYFGRLSAGAPGPQPDPEPPSREAAAAAEIEGFEPFELREVCECRPQVELRFRSIPFGHPDSPVLDVVAGLLNGRTGRLHRGLVLTRDLAFSASARHQPQRRAGSFSLVAEARGGGREPAGLDALQRALEEELERLRREPPDDRELEKVKNQITTDAARQLKKPAGLAQRLLIYDALGGWRYLEDWPRETQRVTAADVQRVLDTWLIPERRAVLRLERTAGEPAPRTGGER
ncbi:MAG TPA: pitrilysin family protein [Thermoanaerobaculia bacterium]|nr:pitrilysin family protein [Thermoanaerobaculia bacterium]